MSEQILERKFFDKLLQDLRGRSNDPDATEGYVDGAFYGPSGVPVATVYKWTQKPPSICEVRIYQVWNNVEAAVMSAEIADDDNVTATYGFSSHRHDILDLPTSERVQQVLGSTGLHKAIPGQALSKIATNLEQMQPYPF